MKLSFDELLQIHTDLRHSCKTTEEWKERWNLAITNSGWEKIEFYDAIDRMIGASVRQVREEAVKPLIIEDRFEIEGRGSIVVFDLETNRSILPVSVGEEVKISEKLYRITGIERFSCLSAPDPRKAGILIKEITNSTSESKP